MNPVFWCKVTEFTSNKCSNDNWDACIEGEKFYILFEQLFVAVQPKQGLSSFSAIYISLIHGAPDPTDGCKENSTFHNGLKENVHHLMANSVKNVESAFLLFINSLGVVFLDFYFYPSKRPGTDCIHTQTVEIAEDFCSWGALMIKKNGEYSIILVLQLHWPPTTSYTQTVTDQK